jgi:hypothetical protein
VRDFAYARAQGGAAVTIDESACEPVVATVRSRRAMIRRRRARRGAPSISPPRAAAEERAHAVAPSAPPERESVARCAWSGQHFDALGVHRLASVTDAERRSPDPARARPRTRPYAEHPGACQRLIARAERALRRSRSPRAERVPPVAPPDIDFEALDDLMAKRSRRLR